MNDNEAIILIKRYTLDCDSYLRFEYSNLLNNFKLHSSTNPFDMLNLYRAKIRYEAFKEFSNDIYKILYNL